MLPGQVAEAPSANVSDIFAEGQLAVHMQIINRDEAVVLLYDAVGACLELLFVHGRPPFAEVAVTIKLASLVVEAVREFVALQSPGLTVIHSIAHVRIVVWRLA